jgi:hypothetical protein
MVLGQETALQVFIKSVQEAVSKHIFLDLTKAYDVLNHRALLSKLDSKWY